VLGADWLGADEQRGSVGLIEDDKKTNGVSLELVINNNEQESSPATDW